MSTHDDPDFGLTPAELRQQAENRLKTSRTDVAKMSPDDIQILVHELQVHQIELDIQNEELRKAQSQLALAHDRYRDLYEFAPVAYLTLDHDRKVHMANLTAATLLGVERGDLVGTRFETLVAPDQRSACHVYLKSVTESGDPQVCELEFQRPDGEMLYGRLDTVPLQTDEGSGWSTTLTDLTERHRAENAIRNIARFPGENPNPVLRIAGQGDLLYANPAARQVLEMCGCSESDGPPAHWRRIAREAYETNQLRRVEVECDDRTFDVAFVPVVDTSYVNVYGLDITLRKRSERVIMAARRQLEEHVESQDLELDNVLQTLQDATAERDVAEQHLSETVAVLESVFDNTHMLIAYLDRTLSFIRVNRAYAAHEGREATFFPGKNYFDLHPSPEKEAIFRNVIETGQPYYATGSMFNVAGHSDISPVHWDWSLQPVRDKDGEVEGMILCLVDVTEELRAEKKLEQSYDQLRSLVDRMEVIREEERARIARDLHDQLGQELTAFKTGLGMLEKKMMAAGGADPDWFRRLAHLSEAVDTAINSVRRISSELRPSLLDNLGLSDAIEQELERFEDRTGIACQFSDGKGVLLTPERVTVLFRTLQEALTNVERHAQAAHVRVSLRRRDNDVILEVEDDGVGISDEQRDAPDALGLLGMKERASAHGGTVVIAGVPAKGTGVIVSFPAEGA